MSGNSSLDPDNFPAVPDRSLGRGHGTGALGPSDTSDSGSDMSGAVHINQSDASQAEDEGDETAMPHYELNDDSDSTTDSTGTGERASVENGHIAVDGADIGTDHIETVLSE